MTATERDDLIVSNLQFARNVARQKHKKHSSVSYDEVEAAAYMGLVEAAGKYDPEQNDEFRGYAYPRIAGAILDFIRELRWGTRSNPLAVVEFVIEDRRPEGDVGELFDIVTRNLTKLNRTVMQMYYVENKKIREIADDIGVHESRISQMLSESRNKLKQAWPGAQSELWALVA